MSRTYCKRKTLIRKVSFPLELPGLTDDGKAQQAAVEVEDIEDLFVNSKRNLKLDTRWM